MQLAALTRQRAGSVGGVAAGGRQKLIKSIRFSLCAPAQRRHLLCALSMQAEYWQAMVR